MPLFDMTWVHRHQYQNTYGDVRSRLGIVASIAPTMAADLAAPNGHKGARVAVGAPPGQDVAVRRLHDSEDMPGALVGHCGRDDGT